MMTLLRFSPKIEHFEKDENITDGLFLCGKCNVLISSYYLRTFSTNCARNVNFGKCCMCRVEGKKKERRLVDRDHCPKCFKKIENHWQQICGEPLKKIQYNDFRNFFLNAHEKNGRLCSFSENNIQTIFKRLSEMDFLTFGNFREVGLGDKQLVKITDRFSAEFSLERQKKFLSR